MKNRPVLFLGMIAMIVLLAWHFSEAQMVFRNGGYPMIYAVSFDGATQYLSRTETGGDLDNTLDMAIDDFMLSAWIRPTSVSASQGIAHKGTFASGIPAVGTNGYILWLASGGILRMTLNDAVTIESDAGPSITVNAWTNIAIIVDRGSNIYFFKYGLWTTTTANIVAGTLSNTSSFFVGSYASSDIKFTGNIDTYRPFRFGINGLTVSGTGGANLSIRVGSAAGPILYSELPADGGSVAVPVGLIPLMYKSPSSNLTQLGFSSIDNAVRSQILAEADFSDGTKWDQTDGWAIADGVLTGTANGTIQTTTQSAANRLSTGLNSHWYAFTYTVISSTLSGDTEHLRVRLTNATFAIVDTYLNESVGTHTLIFLSKSDVTVQAFSLRINAAVTSGTIVLDNFDLRAIGEVADWQLQNLDDGSGNGLTLTNNGSATFVTSKIEALGSVLRSDGSFSIHRSVP